MTMGLSKHLLSVRSDPETAFLALFGSDTNALWFDDHGERGSGMSYLASGNTLTLRPDYWEADLRAAHALLAVPQECALLGVPLGVVVVAPYELAATTLDLPAVVKGQSTIPVALEVTRVIAIDHTTREVWLYGLTQPEDSEWGLWVWNVQRVLSQATTPPAPSLENAQSASWRDSAERYREMIHCAQGAIARGDAYQVCVTTQVVVPGVIDPVALHRVIRRKNPSHHQALLRLGEISLVSASPETFIEITRDRQIITRPIKGTRPRGATPADDEALAVDLLASEKERAENLMIVDLMRNDLSRVCEVGSVHVPELLVLETYASVHQLVSTVSGALKEGVDLVDVLKALFPAGSMTGAPKRSAVALLASWESGPRGHYSGTCGVWRADGSATLAMTIRCAVVSKDSLSLGVGGGITALSDPDAEIAEVGIKALPFLWALGLTQVQYS
jgi:anthranilate synthase component 1